MKITVFSLLFLGLSSVRAKDIRLNTTFGILDGLVEGVTFNGSTKEVARFFGIPFAEPPVGLLRFSKPVPKASLQTVHNATFQRPACMQVSTLVRKEIPKSEDCLYLNIYVPYDSKKVAGAIRGSRLPVMIWIYGGGFNLGSTHDYHADILSSFNDVIVVTVNYRVNIFGFLSTHDSASIGNYGLWDQHLGIQWVHNNIADFGGDKSRVTIFGESTGSASVLYQAWYPGNKGLFQNVIAESGAPFSSWAFNSRGDFGDKYTRKIGENAGCSNMWSQELIACLKQKSALELVKAQSIVPFNATIKNGFTPVLDGVFVTVNPESIYRSTNKSISAFSTPAFDFFRSLNVMVGVNNHDGGVSVGFFASLVSKYNNHTLEDGIPRFVFEKQSMPLLTKELFNVSSPLLVDAFVHEYTNWSFPNDLFENAKNALDLATDYGFLIPAVRSLDIQTAVKAYGSTYMYIFTHHPPFKTLLPEASWFTGANHGDELAYVYFGIKHILFGPSNHSSKAENIDEIKLSSMVMKMWTNFAKSGDPNQPVDVGSEKHWPQYDSFNRTYIDIDINVSVQQRYRAKQVAFWLQFVPDILRIENNERKLARWFQSPPNLVR